MTLAIEWYVDADDPGLGSVDVGSAATVAGGWQTFRAWLAAIETAVQAAGVDYSVDYSATLDRVVIAKISGADAGFAWASDSMARLLGWSAAGDTTTAAAVHTAPNPPGGLVQILGWSLVGATPGRRVEVQDWGFSRARNGSFGAGIEYELEIDATHEATRRWHEGPCSAGRVRVGPLSASAALSSADTSGYLDGQWLDIRRADTRLPTGLSTETRCRLLAGVTPSATGPWAPLERGYSLALYALIDGLPYTFSELAMGLDDESATLVISDRASISSRIDRERGTLGGSQVRLGISLGTPFEAPTLTAQLTADVAHNATTLTVDDTTGWPSSGTLYLGTEACTYSGTTATTFTGVTRGTPAFAYSAAAPLDWSTVSDRPLQWSGRVVRLWAAMVDAYGRRRTDADVQLWCGEVASAPAYDSGLYWLDCEDIARRLTRPIGGDIEANVDPRSRWWGLTRGPIVGIPKTAVANYRVTGPSSYEVSGSETISSLLFDQSEPAGSSDYIWVAYGVLVDALLAAARAAAVGSGHTLVEPYTRSLQAQDGVWTLTLESGQTGATPGDGSVQIGPVVLASGELWPGFDRAIIYSADTATKTSVPSGLKQWILTAPTGLDGRSIDSVVVYQSANETSLSGSTWPSSGVVAIEGADGLEVASYADALEEDGRIYLGGVARAQSSSVPADVTATGATVYRYLVATGTAGVQAGKILQSSGYGDRGDLDTLAFGYALGSDVVAVDELQTQPAGAFITETAVAPSASLEEHLGGLLASQGYAFAQSRGASNELLLTVASFLPFGTATGTLANADLRTDDGPALAEVEPPPNTVTLRPADLAGVERRSTRVLFAEARLAAGVREAEYVLPATLSPFAAVLLRSWGASAIAMRQSCVAYEAGVTPARDWLPGTLLDVDISHPATGTISGLASVLEVTRGLDGRCRIAFMLRSDDLDVGPLCPAGNVTGISTAVLTVTDTIGLDDTETVRVYQAGVAANSSDVTIKAVGATTVELDSVPAWLTAGAIATGAVFITYPDETTGSTRQRPYVHAEDGSQWL